MTLFFFILGLLVGIAILLWNRYALKSQLKNVLTASPDTEDLLGSLPTISLIKREILYLKQECDRQQQELQLRQESLDHAPIAYLRVDEENQLLWCNQKAQELLQIDRWKPGQIRLFLELVRSYELDQLIEQTRQTQTPQINEWVFYPITYAPQNITIENYQTKRPIAASIALKGFSYPLSQGQIEVFIENQQPLIELSRSRDRAFSDLTHELRTPLTSISLVSERLQTRLQEPERRWVEQMLKETRRLISLVKDWLDLSQLEENPYQTLSRQPLQLREVILSTWQILDPLAQQKQINLNYQGLNELEFLGDHSRLMQVFINLLDNSIKHSPPNTEITIYGTINPENNAIEINILDEGEGFLETDLPHIFDRLYRGDPSRTRQGSPEQSLHKGSGLGLAIAQEIIHAHGGTIIAQNHPDTGGAWTQIILPVEI
ncbi:sensor histidine kinase [Crocosphaera sp. XPORK-15E]|uniref:sensor histidine kinase n=1 Tax=Crocosphaera sp. XPORK-15E TaxID=3110247 RepID=UPI002B1F30E4|nr:ATP-binding protein [Crocosphaera sp. XPORK-15E]MEA5534537.1 ATP-binding protein [Crocosphaera sp. XPORK-15E]